MQSQLGKKEMLMRSKKHYFSLGTGDGAANLTQANFQYGLAKMHFAQEELGVEPNAHFISTPDETISRNENRWNSGYGYGGKLTWGDPNDPLIFIDTKPNACGMLVGGLDEMPEPEELIHNVHDTINKDIFIDDVKIKWDYQKGNHFIDVFETVIPENAKNGKWSKLPPYMFIMHGSAPELRKPSEKGPGLYYDDSSVLQDMMKTIDTPFGPIHYLDGSNAKEYLRYFNFVNEFANQKRVEGAKNLFGKFTNITNSMHQGMISYSELLIGAQHISQNEENIFPVALRSDLSAYLVSINPSLTDEVIEDLGFEKRAKSNGIIKNLKNFDCVPHGGGYKLPNILRVIEVKEIDGDRYFVCEQKNEESLSILSSVRESQFIYRGKKIIEKTEKYKLGTVQAKLIPKYIIKV